MSTAAAQLRFAVEFATFLVAVAGGAIVLLRPDLVGAGRRSRSVLFFGFLAIAIAAFLHGSLLTDARESPVIAFRCIGIALLAWGTLGWSEDLGTRRMLWIALVLMTLAECATVIDAATTSDWLRIFAALALGTVLVMSARRSISARIAVSVGSILLVVVLAVSVALSVVIGRNVKAQGFDRIDARAGAESQEIAESATDVALSSAKLTALSIQGSRAEEVTVLSDQPTAGGPRDVIARDLNNLSSQGILVSTGPAPLRHRQAHGGRRLQLRPHHRQRAGRLPGGHRRLGVGQLRASPSRSSAAGPTRSPCSRSAPAAGSSASSSPATPSTVSTSSTGPTTSR